MFNPSSPNLNARPCQLLSLDVVPFVTAWHWQKELVDRHRHDSQTGDLLMLMQHPPVYTLGQGATTDFLKFAPHEIDVELHRIERGGEVTYHCPGQLVGYPIINLRHYQQDLHWYLRQLEEVIIQAIASYGLKGDRIAGMTGVWVEGYKVAAIGIKVSRWITMHGFALNICPELAGFDRIVPCGIANKPVGSLQQFIPDIQVEEVRQRVIEAFAAAFNVNFYSATLAELNL